jgi:hypothetical protein
VERKPWFKPKQFGYGWTPASWQGWVLTLIITVAPLIGIFWLIAHHHPR